MTGEDKRLSGGTSTAGSRSASTPRTTLPKPGWLAAYALALLAALALIDYRISVAIAAGFLILLSLVNPRARLAWFCLGGLALFDSGEGLGLIKIAYTATSLAFAVIAVNSIYKQRRALPRATLAILLTSIAYMAVIVLVLVPLAIFSMGVRPSEAIRDGVTHALPAVGVFFGIEAGAGASRQARYIITGGVCSLAVAQFALTWMTRRGATEGQYYFLGSRAMLALALLFFLVVAIGKRGVVIGTIGASATVASALLSGNRSSILMFIGVPAMAIGSHGKRISLRRISRPALIASAMAALFLLYVVPRTPYAEFVSARTDALYTLFRTGIESDASAASRLAITDRALALFAQDPLLGIGIGGIPNVDSPAVYLAKFGLIGTAVIAAYFLFLFSRLYRTAPRHGMGAPLTMGWGVALLASCISATPTSDPGLAIGIALLTLFCFSEAICEDNDA